VQTLYITSPSRPLLDPCAPRHPRIKFPFSHRFLPNCVPPRRCAGTPLQKLQKGVRVFPFPLLNPPKTSKTLRQWKFSKACSVNFEKSAKYYVRVPNFVIFPEILIENKRVKNFRRLRSRGHFLTSAGFSKPIFLPAKY